MDLFFSRRSTTVNQEDGVLKVLFTPNYNNVVIIKNQKAK